MTIDDLNDCVAKRKIRWTAHVAQRIQERDIGRLDVINCIKNGEIIESYPDDYPHPSCLVYGKAIHGKFLHVVVGYDSDFIYIITAYYPNTQKF